MGIQSGKKYFSRGYIDQVADCRQELSSILNGMVLLLENEVNEDELFSLLNRAWMNTSKIAIHLVSSRIDEFTMDIASDNYELIRNIAKEYFPIRMGEWLSAERIQ